MSCAVLVTQMHLWIFSPQHQKHARPAQRATKCVLRLLRQVLAPCESMLTEDERRFFLIMTSLKMKSRCSARISFLYQLLKSKQASLNKNLISDDEDGETDAALAFSF